MLKKTNNSKDDTSPCYKMIKNKIRPMQLTSTANGIILQKKNIRIQHIVCNLFCNIHSSQSFSLHFGLANRVELVHLFVML